MSVRHILAAPAIFLSACATRFDGVQHGDCASGPVTISGEFEAARLSGCEKTGPTDFTLYIELENIKTAAGVFAEQTMVLLLEENAP